MNFTNSWCKAIQILTCPSHVVSPLVDCSTQFKHCGTLTDLVSQSRLYFDCKYFEDPQNGRHALKQPKQKIERKEDLWETRLYYRQVRREASCSTLTFDLQLAVHLGLSQVIDGLAGVQATVVGAGLSDLQGTYSLVAKHAVARVIDDDNLVLHPDHFGLQAHTQIRHRDEEVYNTTV